MAGGYFCLTMNIFSKYNPEGIGEERTLKSRKNAILIPYDEGLGYLETRNHTSKWFVYDPYQNGGARR